MITNITAVVGAVIAVLGLWQGLKEWRASQLRKRGELIWNIVDKYLSSGFHELFYKYVENDELQYFGGNEHGDSSFVSMEAERDVDRLLTFLNYICYLWDTKLISHNEFCSFEYHVIAALEHKQINEYLHTLNEFTEKNSPYAYLMRYDDYRSEQRNSEYVGGNSLNENTFRRYLVREFGGMTASAGSVLARARRVARFRGGMSLDELISDDQRTKETLRYIEGLEGIKDTVKANLKNAVRHCYHAKHGKDFQEEKER